MKHHIAVKFIAILLCAVSLLGIAGSAVGIFAMAELGLYDRSFDEAYREYAETYAGYLAQDVAVRYTSMTLGGCSSQMADALYGNLWSNTLYDFSSIGYELMAADGEILQTYELASGTPVDIFEFPVTGEYTKVLSTMTEEERNAQEMTTVPMEEDVAGVHVSVVPDGDMDVYGFTIRYSDGSSEGTDYEDTPIGYLSWQEDGSILFRSYENLGWLELRNARRATYIEFRSAHGSAVYEAYSEAHDVTGYYRYQGDVTVIGLFGRTEETNQEEPMIYDALPTGGAVAATMIITYADDTSESVGGAPSIGFISYDENNNVVFKAYDSGILDIREETVTYIAFVDENDNLLYEERNADGVGFFYQDSEGHLIFRTDLLAEEETPAAQPSGDVFLYDDVPPQGHPVHRVELWLKGSEEMYTVEDTQALVGIASRDSNGNVTFVADDWRDFSFSKPAEVVYILLEDVEGRVLYEAYTQGKAMGKGEVIGTFAYNEDGNLAFTVTGEESAPAETIPEAVTVQESIGEDSIAAWGATEPETTETAAADETVPESTVEAAVPATDGTAVPDTAEVTEPVTAVEETAAPDSTEAAAATEMPSATETTEVAAASATVAMGMGVTEPVTYEQMTTAEDTHYSGYYDYELGEYMVMECTYETMPAYTVKIMFAPGALTYDYEWQLLQVVYDLREYVFITLAVSLLVFAVMAVYLCCAAGKKPGKDEIRAGGLNMLPLDLYLGLDIGMVAGLAMLGVTGTRHLIRNSTSVAVLFALLAAFGACLILVGFCFACVAQFKTPGGYWWRNSLCGRCLKLIAAAWNWLLRVCVWLGEHYDSKVEPLLVRFFKACWKLIRFFWGLLVKTVLWLVHLLEKGTNWMGDKLVRFFSMLPVTWQWLLVGIVLVLWLFIAVGGRYEGMLVAWVCAAIAIVIYGAHCFGVLLESAKHMSKGNLEEKVDDKLLIGSFREFAGELNSLADVAVVAAQKQLKSERMKTELITNVSHDIKTPLTSIINYVDLLQKPHTDEEQEVYLEVLDRQSQRLKKLIDDLMEMSKATTGNLAVDIQKVDAAEAINQALGEFSDKLEKAQLIPVFRQPETPVEMMADGRLVWRVMSNLLGNAVKYALPGTRVYLDLVAVDGKVIISMKNISREELNVQADELLERFVRGDVSRNTEGSGLGLNIAQSLMELQKGQLQLLVDGDLFKVTLIFPGA